DQGPKDKAFLPMADAVSSIVATLQSIHDTLLARATAFRDANTVEVDSMDALKAFFASETDGGFALAHWAGSPEDEDALAKELKITVRCIPNDPALRGGPGTCIGTGQTAEGRVVFAKAY
ncbi:MAG: proline--tRNA ligase, partial [Verrucomicrobiae bacterium]|nr:proline--tRNA ligase [Verrucomicrobiae bacterium]